MTPDNLGSKLNDKSSGYNDYFGNKESPVPASTVTSTLFKTPYDGVDQLGATNYILDPFNFTKPDIYNASPQHIILPTPLDEGSVPSLNITQQMMIRSHFANEALGQMQGMNITEPTADAMVRYLMTNENEGLSVKDQNIADKIGLKATVATQEALSLTPTWTPTSSPLNWQQKPPHLYTPELHVQIKHFFDTRMAEVAAVYIHESLQADPPRLSKSEAEDLRMAAESPEFDPDKDQKGIAVHFRFIRRKAQFDTQKQFGLPVTWERGTTIASDWEAVNLSLLNPMKVQEVNTKKVLTGCELITEEFITVIEKLGKSPIKTVQTQVNNEKNLWINFLKDVAKALSDAKRELELIEIRDAEFTKTLSGQKFDALNDRRTERFEHLKEQAEQLAAEAKAKMIGFWTAFAGYLLSALIIVASAAAIFFSGGAATGVVAELAVPALILSVGMIGYQVADHFKNLTPTISAAIGEGLDIFVGAIAPHWSKTMKLLLKIAIMVFIVIVIVAITRGAGAAALARGTLIGSTAAGEFLAASITQVSLQVAMMLLMNPDSGIGVVAIDLTHLFKPSANAHDEFIAQMVAMAVVMVGMMFGMSVAEAGGLKNWWSGTKESLSEAADGTKRVLNRMSNSIGKLFSSNSASRVNVDLQEEEDALRAAMQASKKLNMKYNNPVEEFLRLRLPAQSKQVLTLGQHINDATGGILQGQLNLILADMYKKIGSLESADAEMTAVIQVLEKLLKKLQDGMANMGDDLQAVQDVLNHIYQSTMQTTTKLNAATSPG
ncbi:MAG: hypothetical protein H0W88_04090 [Parachlamydiaceae bacterium]|nr:hypothetical protein [Parachlamydiaceae bacterium]